MAFSAPKISKDKKMLLDAEEIRNRAVRTLGQLIKAQKETVGLAKPGGDMRLEHRGKNNPDAPSTLAEAGIDKNLAKRARKLAALDDNKFEAKLKTWRDNPMANETSFAVGDMLKAPVRGTQGTGENEWHTPEEYLDLARALRRHQPKAATAARRKRAKAYRIVR
jgi:hypothetical protein